MNKRLDIAVVGAGIGGLAAASLLADQGHHITIFDQFDSPRPIGSGLVIQPVGQIVLGAIGIDTSGASLGTPIYRLLGHEAASGRRVLDVTYGHKGGRAWGLGLHRGDLFSALYQAALHRGVMVETSARVTGRDGQRLMIESRKTECFDLIIDASGAGSTLSGLRARALPYGAIWGTVDWPDTTLPMDELRQVYRRADRMLGVLPLGRGATSDRPKAAIFWSLPADTHDAWRAAGIAAWRDEATQLWPEFAPFAGQITDPEQMTMARYSHGTARHPWGDGIVSIGDAAHRASPQLGQGANMALLDAYALARAIGATHHLPDALRAYGLGRRWHVRTYQAFSAVFTPQYQSDSRALPALRDHVLFPMSQIPPVPRVLSALVRGTLLPPLGSLGPL